MGIMTQNGNKHVVFMHQNYPAQFGPVIPFLLKNYDVDISFFSEYVTKPVFKDVNHYFFRPVKTRVKDKHYFYSKSFEDELARMQGILTCFNSSNLNEPDVIVNHPGFINTAPFSVAFPEAVNIGFFEFFYDAYDKVCDRRPEFPIQKEKSLRIPIRNATQLLDLEYCTKGYSPTPFQKSTFPKAYQDKIAVLFDGIDTNLYRPEDVSNKSELKRTWPKGSKLVTYVSRGLEAMRGFDIFMEAAHKISQQREDVHFLIAGNPKTHYGSELGHIKESSFKEHVLKQHKFDLNRFHFFNWVSESALVDLYRLSDCHFYWTVPFTLSWSFLQAMSTGVLMVGSNSLPVRDALQHNVNGLMVEPYDIEMIVETILDVLSNPNDYTHMRQFAREKMIEEYSFDVCLPKLAEFYMGKTEEASNLSVGSNLLHV